MTAADYLSGGFKLIGVASPFLIVSLAIYYSRELIGVVRNAVLGRERQEW
ncbi:hypothetical protein [Paenibacillus sp. MMO-177]